MPHLLAEKPPAAAAAATAAAPSSPKGKKDKRVYEFLLEMGPRSGKEEPTPQENPRGDIAVDPRAGWSWASRVRGSKVTTNSGHSPVPQQPSGTGEPTSQSESWKPPTAIEWHRLLAYTHRPKAVSHIGSDATASSGTEAGTHSRADPDGAHEEKHGDVGGSPPLATCLRKETPPARYLIILYATPNTNTAKKATYIWQTKNQETPPNTQHPTAVPVNGEVKAPVATAHAYAHAHASNRSRIEWKSS
jgi:hypothetical protein